MELGVRRALKSGSRWLAVYGEVERGALKGPVTDEDEGDGRSTIVSPSFFSAGASG